MNNNPINYQSTQHQNDQPPQNTQTKEVMVNEKMIDQETDPESTGEFLQRVGKMPLFSGVVRAYERGKGTSKVVRYGADLVESSVTSLSGRVVSKVGPQRIAQIDRYAGAALDRLGQFSQSQPSNASACHHCNPAAPPGLLPQAHAQSSQEEFRAPVEEHVHVLLSHPSHHHPAPDHYRPQFHSSLSSIASQHTPHHYSHQTIPDDDSELPTPAASPGGRLVHLTPRNSLSRWQNMLVEAGVTAGGIGAAVSEESMKSLQYCLQWLHYATVHMDHQITVLRDFINSLNVGVPSESYRSEEDSQESQDKMMISARAAATLAQIKTDVVETIRKVVSVVSRYAGVGLPEPAKQFVRTSILGLPLRWAEAIQPGPSTSGSSGSHAARLSHSKAATILAAGHVLTFAVESLDMLKSITAIFSESVERADAWVERLRLIGIQHRNQQAKNERDGWMAGGHERAREGHVVTQGKPEAERQLIRAGSPGPIETRRPVQGALIRSRSSSASTLNESARSLSDSLMSGWSAVGSLNTASTLGSTTTLPSSDRASAKRRKANTPPPSSSWTAPSLPPLIDDASQVRFPSSDPAPTSSLHKLLLDHDQVSAFDLVHRWAYVDPSSNI